jgi:hypothetical protein
MKCKDCNIELADNTLFCPNCNVKIGRSLLKLRTKSALDREIEQKLAKKNSTLLQMADSLDNLYKSELDANYRLAKVDIKNALLEIERTNEDIFSNLENFLASKSENLSINGMNLSELVSNSDNEIEILKKGIIFLKHRHYKEAIEWWKLNRKNISNLNFKFELLLLILEAYSYTLIGDIENSSRLYVLISKHSLYKNFKE